MMEVCAKAKKSYFYKNEFPAQLDSTLYLSRIIIKYYNKIDELDNHLYLQSLQMLFAKTLRNSREDDENTVDLELFSHNIYFKY